MAGMSSEGHCSLVVCALLKQKKKKCSFTVNDQSAEMLTKPCLGSTKAELGTFKSVRVFNKCAVRRQWDTFQLRQKHLPWSIWGKVPGVKSLFPRKRLERRVGALSPDVFDFHFQVFPPNTA